MSNQSIGQVDYVGAEEATRILGVSLKTLYKYTHRKRIAFNKPGGKLLRFRLSDLHEFMERNRTAAAT